jgi:Zn-finger nucleic acid-binding protein
MDCPKCGHQLVSRTVGSQSVQECEACHGLWLSARELHEAVDEAAPDLAWLDFDIWRDAGQFSVTERPMKCPQCGTPMLTLEYADTGIQVDYCRSCEGIWLDADELPKIVRALNEEANTRSVPEYIVASLEEARELLAGPTGPRAEWRDLRQVLRLLQYRILSEHPGWLKGLTDIERSIPS